MKVLICYLETDQLWADELERYLAESGKEIEVAKWSHQAPPRPDWISQVDQAFNDVDAAVLLMSSAFSKSGFFEHPEIQTVFQKRRDRAMYVFGVPVGPGDLTNIQRGKALDTKNAFERDPYIWVLLNYLVHHVARSDFQPSQHAEPAFPETNWDVVRRAGEKSQEGQKAFKELHAAYAPVLLDYLRRTGQNEELAQDLIPDFFKRLWETRALRRVNPRQGRFELWLIGALNHFLSDQWGTIKR